MSLPRQEQERQVQQYIKEHPELKEHKQWIQTDGQMYPYYDANQDVSKSLPVKNILLERAKHTECLQNETTLLLYLLKHRPFKGKADGKHKTSSVWYHQRGLIVASVGVEKIADDLRMDERTILRWLAKLEDAGLIRRVKECREAVYVLGEIVNGKEVFYYAQHIKVVNMKDYLA